MGSAAFLEDSIFASEQSDKMSPPFRVQERQALEKGVDLRVPVVFDRRSARCARCGGLLGRRSLMGLCRRRRRHRLPSGFARRKLSSLDCLYRRRCLPRQWKATLAPLVGQPADVPIYYYRQDMNSADVIESISCGQRFFLNPRFLGSSICAEFHAQLSSTNSEIAENLHDWYVDRLGRTGRASSSHGKRGRVPATKGVAR